MPGKTYLLRDLKYRYPGGPFELDLDRFEVDAGKTIALVGPNGAGKSTLLYLLALLNRPDRGRFEFMGADPWQSKEEVFAKRREVVLVTHHPYLFSGTIFDNLVFGLKVRGIDPGSWKTKVEDALSMLELHGFENKNARELSAGQAQRVALARAIILKPQVLLLDEPTANIDASLINRVEAVISEVNSTFGTIIIFSTHNFPQAFRMASEIVYFSGGKRVTYSHENYFSGIAETDGKMSWIQPKPGVRISFSGALTGHLTCVVSPQKIEIFPIQEKAKLSGSNLFSGQVTGLEMAEHGLALVWVSGDLNFRVNLPVDEINKKNIALSGQILVRFSPEAVEVIK